MSLISLAAAVVAVVIGSAAALAVGPNAAAGQFAGFALMGIPGLVLGWAVARDQPGNGVAAFLSLAGLSVLAIGAYGVYTAAGAGGAFLSDAAAVPIAVAQGAWVFLYVPWALVLLVFPDGRLSGRLSRWTAWVLVSTALGFDIIAALAPNVYSTPFEQAHRIVGPVPAMGAVGVALLPVMLACLVSSVVVAARRRHAGDARVRAQYRWLVAAGLALPATLVLCWAGYLVFGASSIVVLGLGAIYTLLPATIAAGVLRSDIVDSSRFLAVAGSWCSVAFVVVIAVAASLARVGGAAEPGQPQLVTGAVVAIAVVCVTMTSLRGALEGWIAARLDPTRTRVLSAVSAFERDIVAGRAEADALESVLRDAARDEYLRVGYVLPGAVETSDAMGRRLDGGVAVRLGGQRIGAVVAGPTWIPPREVLDAIAMTVELGRERFGLEAALRDVEVSRARLLQAGHDERVKLERDLHDGAQQRLVALGLMLREAQRKLPPEGYVVSGLLDAAVAEVGTALAELRQLAHGIRPSILDAGLAAALSELASRCPMPAELAVSTPLVGVPDVVTETMYFVASEALVNAVKHAGASRIELTVAQTDGHVRIEVRDDGRGGAVIDSGGGLAGLADRVEALGGSLRLDSRPEWGTLVRVVLPCAL